MSIYQAKPNKPYHLSVGAVVLTKNNKVLCHYWDSINDLKNIFLLMSETIEDKDNNEIDALKRGLMEEMGIDADVVTYIGSTQDRDKWFGEINQEVTVEKTTIFFLVKVKSWDISKRIKEGEVNNSKIIEMDIDELIEKMNDQYNRYKINYLNQTKALINAKNYLKINSE